MCHSHVPFFAPAVIDHSSGAGKLSSILHPNLASLKYSFADMPDFPTELVSEIISYLDPANPQDLHTLTACNLVSLTFSAASRAVPFHTICISAELTVHGFYERRDHN
jgi:hypothetical protein